MARSPRRSTAPLRVESLEDRLTPAAALPRPGAFDPSFSGDGRAAAAFGADNAFATSVALDAQGRTVVAGSVSRPANGSDPGGTDIALARFNADGTPDTTFGPDATGRVVSNANAASGGVLPADFNGQATAVAIDPTSGDIVVAGSIQTRDRTTFTVVRYRADGVAVQVSTPFYSPSGPTGGPAADFMVADSVSVDAQGRVLASGHALTLRSPANTYESVLVRLTPADLDGNGVRDNDLYLDTTFGPSGSGYARTTLGAQPQTSRASYTAAVGPSGEIYVAGETGADTVVLARFTGSGVLDPTFDGDGVVTRSLAPPGVTGAVAFIDVTSVLVAPGGTVLVGAGVLTNRDNTFTIAGFDPDGTAGDYGTDGLAQALVAPSGSGNDFNGATLRAIALDPSQSGRVLAVGTTNGADFVLARFTPTGFLDTGFGATGSGYTTGLFDPADSGSTGGSQAVGVAADANGRATVVGATTRFDLAAPFGFGAARLNPAGTIKFDPSAVAVDEGAGTATLTLTRTDGMAGVLTVTYSTAAGGTATAGADYDAVSGDLTWADGDTTPKSITVPITDDAADEADETFLVTLTRTAGGIGTETATVTILDDDDTPVTPPGGGSGGTTPPGGEGGGTTPPGGGGGGTTPPGGGGTTPPATVRLSVPAVPAGETAVLTVTRPDGTRFTLPVFEADFTGGVKVALADINGDGVDDIVAGAGDGGAPRVKVFDGATGRVLADFFAYEDSFRGGVNVAIAADGTIVAGAGVGGGPRVRVFAADGSPLADFLTAEETFRGGVTVAAGDVNGDGVADVVAGAGPGGGAVVRVFDGATGAALNTFPADADPDDRGGVAVAVRTPASGGAAAVVTKTADGTLAAFDPLTGDDVTGRFTAAELAAAFGG